MLLRLCREEIRKSIAGVLALNAFLRELDSRALASCAFFFDSASQEAARA